MRTFTKLGLVATVGLMAAVALVPVREQTFWVDAVTGTTKVRVTWIGRFEAVPVVTPSPLDARLRRAGVAWEPVWRNTAGSDASFLGLLLGLRGRLGHGQAPPIYPFRGDMQEAYLSAASDAEVRALADVLRGEDEAAQRAAVDAAVDRALGALGRRADTSGREQRDRAIGLRDRHERKLHCPPAEGRLPRCDSRSSSPRRSRPTGTGSASRTTTCGRWRTRSCRGPTSAR
jgi:hypothetical protein